MYVESTCNYMQIITARSYLSSCSPALYIIIQTRSVVTYRKILKIILHFISLCNLVRLFTLATTTDKPMLRRCVARRTRGRKCGYTCMKETSHSCVDIIATSTQPHVYVCSSAIDKYIEVEETDTVEGLAVDLCDSSTMNVAALDNDIVGIVDSNESDFKCNNGHPHNDNGCHGDDHHSDDDVSNSH